MIKYVYLSKIFLSTFIVGFFIYSCINKWPQYKGPENNIIADGNNLPEEWNSINKVNWTYEISGESWSSPIIWDNKVFISTAVLEKNDLKQEMNNPVIPDSTTDDTEIIKDIYRWELTCIDLRTGKEIWKRVAHKGNPRIKKHTGNTYASETPVTDGKRIYVYYGMTGVFCYNMDGNLLWEKDLGAYKTQYGWGTGSSPALFGDLLFVQVDNEENSFIVALDTSSGDEKWRLQRDEKTTYSTPVIWHNKIRTELVTSGKTIRSYDPETGKLLWQLAINGEYAIISPVPGNECIFVSNEGEPRKPAIIYAVRAGASGDITPVAGEDSNKWILWSNRSMETGMNLLYKDFLYNISNEGGIIGCYKVKTGEMIYKKEADNVSACWASPWAYNDKIYFLDQRGVTHIVKAGEKFEILPSNKIEDKFWASIAITDGSYIFKGVKRLYCIKK